MSNKATSAVNQQGSEHIKHYVLRPSETIRRISQMNRELVSLLGLLFTDGCVSPKGNSWRICFTNKSKSLIDLFRDCMTGVFGLDVRRVRIHKTKDGLLEAVVGSKEIGNYLVGKFGTFRTLKFKDGKLPEAKLPVSELLKSGYAREFLRVAFSCDGGVCFYSAHRDGPQGGTNWLIRNVLFACMHPRLRIDYMSLLEALNIEAKELSNDGKIRIQRESEIRKFHKLVGFVKGTKVTGASRFWCGHEKQYILELMISSYGNPAKIYNLPKFYLR